MKTQMPPEMKIAFIGSRKSGKSSLVNCFLEGKHGAGVNGISNVGINAFRVKAQNGNSTSKPSATSSSTNATGSFTFGASSPTNVTPSSLRASSSTNATASVAFGGFNNIQNVPTSLSPSITNKFICLPDLRTMHVMTTDVPLQDDLFDMNLDSGLILIDVPGINPQDSQDVFMQYLIAQWDSFDCVVVVLSALEDVMMQLDVLHLVKENQISNREIPIIFVCNKVDNMMNQDVMKHLEQVQKDVMKRFEQLQKLVKSIFMMPIISLSAENALICRYSWTLQRLQELFQQDRPLFDKLASTAVPNWKASSGNLYSFNNIPESTIKQITTSMADEAYWSRMIAFSNFPSFLSALSDCVLCYKEQKFLDEKKTDSTTQ